MDRRTEEVCRRRIEGGEIGPEDVDWLAVEEPLEIRIEGRPVAITMRTPGDDLELAAGFLFSEGVIDGEDDLVALAHVDDPSDPQGNTVDVVLAAGVPVAQRQSADRSLFASSACGICGKTSIDQIRDRVEPVVPGFSVPPEILHQLPGRMASAQAVFDQTGGLHAAALFTAEGTLEVLREDIGRHNAVDKIIGWRLMQDAVPIDDRLLLVSGRVGFEIVQKAAVAGIPMLASVGAPSSLAAQLARSVGMVLVGFLRNNRYNIYF